MKNRKSPLGISAAALILLFSVGCENGSVPDDTDSPPDVAAENPIDEEPLDDDPPDDPPPPTAPPDANFNSALNILLDTTVSVTEFVSYPDGDTVDRVRFDVTDMNPNTSASGGRARLVITASCFGTGTQHVRFSTGGQTFSCGQTLVDREVTDSSSTGQITIEATGGEGTYVQWVLAGTATRVD